MSISEPAIKDGIKILQKVKMKDKIYKKLQNADVPELDKQSSWFCGRNTVSKSFQSLFRIQDTINFMLFFSSDIILIQLLHFLQFVVLFSLTSSSALNHYCWESGFSNINFISWTIKCFAPVISVS